MTATRTSDGTAHFVDRHKEFSANGAGGTPEWLKHLREVAIERFAEQGFPTTRQEEWRLTSVKRIAEHPFALPHAADTMTPDQLTPFLLPSEEPVRLVFVNGIFVPGLSHTASLPAGVQVRNLAAALAEDAPLIEKHLGKHADMDRNPFTALNTAFVGDGAFVYVPANTLVEQPVECVFFSTSGEEPVMSHPRNLVVVENGGRLAFIETYGGTARRPYLTNAVTEVVVGDNARVDCYRIQREGEQAFHIATTTSTQGRDSRYSLTPIVLGASLSRHYILMGMNGEGGEGTLNGLYLMSGDQHVDHNTVIDHAVPHCDSHEYFNGVLAGRSHAVFSGKIVVRPGAQKTDSKQTNNNLLLSDDARADSQPQLEIYADDVRCTHGATLGPLDEDALFYLRTRGLDRERANALLTYGFGVEILNRVALPELRERLDTLVKERLHDFSRMRVAG
ncbi:MAG: Fe-S cluster assembly protein SufD [Gemmatimonadetes bacterium]|nr:Fe-S cluster assembly protein SufD [Gemmatimonadota bacterium]